MDIKTAAGEWIAFNTGLSEGEREFAVGDVHGHGFELGELLTSLHNLSGGSLADTNLTFLGDLTDRGPCSIGAVRLAAAAELKFGFKSSHMILGNHEIMMIAAMGLVRNTSEQDIMQAYEIWMHNGGDRVLEEVDARLPGRFPCRTTGEFISLMTDAFGADGMNFLMSGNTHRISGNMMFCHAGIDPNAASVEEWFSTPPWPVTNERMNWSWARDNFYGHEGVYPGNRTVVHGHTPEISIRAWKGQATEIKDAFGGPVSRNLADFTKPDGHRIGLDGGSFASGVVLGAEFIPGAYRTHFAWNPHMLLQSRLEIRVPEQPGRTMVN